MYLFGYDSREQDAYDVCEYTIKETATNPDNIRIFPLVQNELREKGLYKRPVNEPASTEFAFTRFLVPHLCNYRGLAVFVDCDFLFTRDIQDLFYEWENMYAVSVVKHNYTPKASIKMDRSKTGCLSS